MGAWQQLIPVHPVKTLEQAVEISFNLASAGDNVLLSPACSSYDMFKDFEDRGEKFKHNVKNLKERINGINAAAGHQDVLVYVQ